MKIAKKIVNIVLDIFLICLLFISTVVVISSINQKNDGYSHAFGYTIQAVQSDSMKGTFEKGDIIISKDYAHDGTVEEGDIVTFKANVNGVQSTITHRIREIDENGRIYTRGDNEEYSHNIDDNGYRTDETVLAIYDPDTCLKLVGLGTFTDWLKTEVGFITVVVIPISAYIIYQIIYLIRLYLKEKKSEMVEEAKAGTSDEVKDAIIKAYLAEQEAKAKAEENK